MQELEGFTYAMALDLNMGYYTISLDPDASKICTIIFPWGKYSYKRLPMGIAGSPEIFQEKMSDLIATLEFVQTYFDDLLIITKGSLEDHLEKLSMVLTRLQDAGLMINADKSNFCTLETEYLGYILTRDGIKSQVNKVQAILALAPPRNVKELHSFLGMFNIIETSEQDTEKCLPLSPHWLESVVRLQSQRPKEPERSRGIGPKSIKMHLMT